MAGRAILCSSALLATLVVAEPADTGTEPSAGGADVAVKAVRFSDGPPAYSFLVQNTGTKPIKSVCVGSGEGAFIEASLEAVPTSIGSPKGWKGMVVFAHDTQPVETPLRSGIAYLWIADDANGWIPPGQSLSGFSLQFAVSRKDDQPVVERRPTPPDLSRAPFVVRPSAARPITGNVELD